MPNRIPRQYATRPNVFIMPDPDHRRGKLDEAPPNSRLAGIIVVLSLAAAVMLTAWITKLLFAAYHLPRPF